MYTDLYSMKDMLEMNLTHKRYVPILLLSRFTDIEELQELRTSVVQKMLKVWKEELLHVFTKEDACCVINSGNVLVLVKDTRAKEFIHDVSNVLIYGTYSMLETDVMVLSDDISQLILDFA